MARKKKKPAEEGGGGGAPGWMVTFGDLMSLLLTFFVLLLSFSSIQQIEFQKALGSLKGALGVLPQKESVIYQIQVHYPSMGKNEQKRLKRVSKELNGLVKLEKPEGQLDVLVTKDGILVRIDSPVLFDLARADLKPAARPILNKVIELAHGWENHISVEGHTDDLPIRTREFPSNWELSSARALSVLRHFLEDGDIAPQRLSASGYGEYHPLFPNDLPENRARNRRVEIYIKPLEKQAESYKAIDLLTDEIREE